MRLLLAMAAMVSASIWWAPAAIATTLAPVTFAHQASAATLIFRGIVKKVEPFLEAAPGGRRLKTRVEFAVLDVYKGSAPASKILIFAGGKVGKTEERIAAMPEFVAGQELILFVGDERSICPLIGWGAGCYHVRRDQREARVEMRSIALDPPEVLDDGTVLRAAKNEPVCLDDFEGRLRRKLAGAPGR